MAKIAGLDSGSLARARRRGKHLAYNGASTVSYHPTTDSVRIMLNNGTAVLIPRAKIDGLRGLPKAAAHELKVGFEGQALTIERRDVHISVGGLIRKAVMGNDPFAQAGRSRSPAKARAARANGLRGGRPTRAA